MFRNSVTGCEKGNDTAIKESDRIDRTNSGDSFVRGERGVLTDAGNAVVRKESVQNRQEDFLPEKDQLSASAGPAGQRGNGEKVVRIVGLCNVDRGKRFRGCCAVYGRELGYPGTYAKYNIPAMSGPGTEYGGKLIEEKRE